MLGANSPGRSHRFNTLEPGVVLNLDDLVEQRPTGWRAQFVASYLQSFRRNSIKLGSSRHFFLIFRDRPPGSQAARAFALRARSVSA